jgi:hypothetical protein
LLQWKLAATQLALGHAVSVDTPPLHTIVKKLNNRPRKALGERTSQEVLSIPAKETAHSGD